MSGDDPADTWTESDLDALFRAIVRASRRCARCGAPGVNGCDAPAEGPREPDPACVVDPFPGVQIYELATLEPDRLIVANTSDPVVLRVLRGGAAE